MTENERMKKPKVRHFLETECQKIVVKLKAMSFAELSSQGQTLNTVAAYDNDREATMKVIVKQESKDRILVVVQCFMPMEGIMGWLRVKHVNVDGFRRYDD